MTGDLRPAGRVPLLLLGFASLVLGVSAGLALLGWPVPVGGGRVAHHGALMIGGFFGTVIGLERAVALRRLWAYAAPLAAGLGAACLGLAPAAFAGPLLLSAAAALFTAASVGIYVKQPAPFTATLALGALLWLVGNAVWLAGAPVSAAAPWWIGFLVLTIAGERLELSRLLRPSIAARRLFFAIVALLLAGLLLGLARIDGSGIVFAVALLALALWLLRHDIARRTVAQPGLARFIAVCLLSGYGWLAIGALVLLFGGPLAPGPHYDAALHAILLGFVFSMVFGHAPIILPAVLPVRLPYHPLFYVPLLALHASLLLRLYGDAIRAPEWRGAGGLANAVALLLFIVTMLGAAARGGRAARAAGAVGKL